MEEFDRKKYIAERVTEYGKKVYGVVKNFNDPNGLAKELTGLFQSAVEDAVDHNVKNKTQADLEFDRIQKRADG